MKSRDEKNIEEGVVANNEQRNEQKNEQKNETIKEPVAKKVARERSAEPRKPKPAPVIEPAPAPTSTQTVQTPTQTAQTPVQAPVQTAAQAPAHKQVQAPIQNSNVIEPKNSISPYDYRDDDMDDTHTTSVRRDSDDRQRNRGWEQPQQQRSYQNNSNNNSNNNYRSQRSGGNQRSPASGGGSQDQKFSALRQYELKQITIDELSLQDLNLYARRLGMPGATLLSKPELIKKIKYVEANPDMEMKVEGVLEKLPDGFGFLRSSQFDYVSGPDDVYVSPSQIRRFNLKTGDMITGVLRKPKEGEKYFALLKVDTVNYGDPAKAGDRLSFERLTPLHPDKKFNLEIEHDPKAISTRIMDVFTPIGRGQRGLIVAPPKVGKTVLLKEIVKSLIVNHPEDHLIVLLIDERPEEVTDMKKAIIGSSAEVISSTFDESAERHVQVAELVLEKAKRLVEAGRDVIILLDAITRLARAYNTVAPASGKVLTGGIDANALQRPKRFFGAARNTQEGGSLTIIATALVDTGSRMDEVIYEEFKGTGNMEMHMTRKLSNRRVYPAFDLMQSGTRRDDLLHDPEDLNKVWVLQKFLSSMNTIEGMEFLIEKIKKTKNNRDFLDMMNKKADTGTGNKDSGEK